MKNKIIKFLILVGILMFMNSCAFLNSDEKAYSKANDCIKTGSAQLSIVLPNSYPNIKWDAGKTIDGTSLYLYRRLGQSGVENFHIGHYKHPYADCTNSEIKYSLIEDSSKNVPLKLFYYKRILRKEYGYRKDYIDYIAGLKCHTYFKTKIVPREYDIEGDYRSCCLYYNINNELIVLDIHSGYNNVSGDINSNIQQIFKSDMKEIYYSLKLHDIDIQKSKEAGFYYGKPFDLNAEDKPIKMFMSKEFLEDLKDLELEQKIKQKQKVNL